MTRTLRAFVWLRWRLLRNSVGKSQRRDTLEQISRMLALFVPLALAALSVGSFVAAGFVGYFAGRAIGSGLAGADTTVFVLRLVLFGALVLLVSFAVVTPTQTALSRYTRLLLLPIHRHTLHLVEVLAGIADPWLAVTIPGLFSFAAGLAVGGMAGAAAVTLAASIALVGVFAVLGALLGFLVSWLVKNRRRGEIFTLVSVLLITVVSFFPAMFAERLDDRPRGSQRGLSRADVERALPFWTQALPSELYGRTVSAAIAGRADRAIEALLLLVAEGALLFIFSSAAHRRLLDAVESNRGSRSSRRDVAARRVPLARPAVSAIAIAQFRTAMRSVRGRLGVLLPGPIVAMFAFMFSRMPDEAWAVALASHGHLMFGASTIFALYSLQPFTMNLFGADRAGLTLQFLAPVSDRDLARGKILGCALVFALTLAINLVAALAVAANGSPMLWLASLLNAGAMFLLLSPLCVWLSALFPMAADLSKAGSGGNPHPLPMLGGTVVVLALAAPGGVLLWFGANWFGAGIVLGLMFVWLLLAAAISLPLLGVASRAIAGRRENLALVAQGR